MDHETLIGDIESRAGHGRRAANSEVNMLHTRIEVVIDVIRGTGAHSWLNLFFNGPRSAEILDSHDAKIAIAPANFIPLPTCRELDEL
ncbi:unnamed protein product [Sphagnum troendelagicum]